MGHRIRNDAVDHRFESRDRRDMHPGDKAVLARHAVATGDLRNRLMTSVTAASWPGTGLILNHAESGRPSAAGSILIV